MGSSRPIFCPKRKPIGCLRIAMAARHHHGSRTSSTRPTIPSAPRSSSSGCGGPGTLYGPVRAGTGSQAVALYGTRALTQVLRQPHEVRHQAGLGREPTLGGAIPRQQPQLHGATWTCGRPLFGGYAYSAPRPAAGVEQTALGSGTHLAAGVQPMQYRAPCTSPVPCRGFYGACWYLCWVCTRDHLSADARRV